LLEQHSVHIPTYLKDFNTPAQYLSATLEQILKDLNKRMDVSDDMSEEEVLADRISDVEWVVEKLTSKDIYDLSFQAQKNSVMKQLKRFGTDKDFVNFLAEYSGETIEKKPERERRGSRHHRTGSA
jgi:hypothetical protein